jgi:RNA polymerase sigma-70 factor (ECF subfamily)
MIRRPPGSKGTMTMMAGSTSESMAEVATEPDARRRDAILLAQVASGDTRAFAELYEAHRHRVYRLAYGVLLDPAEARDAVQEAFLRLHQVARTWEPRATVATWLYRVVLNYCLSLKERLLRLARPARPMPRTLGDVRSPEVHATVGEGVRIVERSLASLPRKQRSVACLFLEAELAPSEIAELLDMTPNAARVTLHRALSRLRADLAAAGIDAPPDPEEALAHLEES